MRNECNIIRDLLPLYVENIASEDTAEFVKEHLETCTECSRALESLKSSDAIESACAESSCDGDEAAAPLRVFMKNINRRLNIFYAMFLMFGIFFGLGLTTGHSELFYNSLIMPAIGALGYIVFRWRALYTLPILMLLTDFATYLLNHLRGDTSVDLFSLLMFSVIYCAFILIGFIIAWLLHFALRKEK